MQLGLCIIYVVIGAFVADAEQVEQVLADIADLRATGFDERAVSRGEGAQARAGARRLSRDTHAPGS
jgi:hypothetical protein